MRLPDFERYYGVDFSGAKKAGDAEAERAARDRVHAAKVALGERGPKWWEPEES